MSNYVCLQVTGNLLINSNYQTDTSTCLESVYYWVGAVYSNYYLYINILSLAIEFLKIWTVTTEIAERANFSAQQREVSLYKSLFYNLPWWKTK